jgi:hypothetical protein
MGVGKWYEAAKKNAPKSLQGEFEPLVVVAEGDRLRLRLRLRLRGVSQNWRFFTL